MHAIFIDFYTRLHCQNGHMGTHLCGNFIELRLSCNGLVMEYCFTKCILLINPFANSLNQGLEIYAANPFL